MNVKYREINKKRIRGIFAALFLMVMVFSVHISASEPEILTIEKAIEMTLESNIDLKKNLNNVRSKKSIFDMRKMNFLPDLSITGNYAGNYKKVPDEQSGIYEASRYGNLNLSVSSSIVLFNGFSLQSAKKQAFSLLQGAKETFTRNEQSAVYQTILNYLDVVLAKELIRVGNENLRTQGLLLERIEDFFNAGKKAALDVYYQKSEIANSQYQLLNYEKLLRLSKLKLMEGMGLTGSLDFDVIAPAADDPGIFVDLEKTDILETAKKNRTDLKAAELNLNAAEQGLTVARSGFYPVVSLYGGVSSGYSTLNSAYSLHDQLFRNNTSGSIGVSVSVPLFDRGSTRNNVLQAKLGIEDGRLEMQNTINRIWTELIESEENFSTAIRLVDASVKKLDYSKTALESMTERYNVNAATITEVSQARSQYLQAQYDRVDAKLNLFRQGITVLYYMGDIDRILSVIK